MTLVLNSVLGEYYGVQGTTWQNPPLLDSPSGTQSRRRRKLFLYAQGGKPDDRRLAHPAGRVLDLQHADDRHLQRADGRDRRVADARGIASRPPIVR